MRKPQRTKRNGQRGDWAEQAACVIIERFEALNTAYLRMLGERIAQIGRVSPTDLYRLERLRDVGADMAKLKRELSRQTGLALKELEALLNAAAREALTPYAGVLESPKGGAAYLLNEEATAMAAAQFLETGREMVNLSRTTVSATAYRALVDRAISAVQLGTESYQGAIRAGLRQTAWEGLCIDANGTRRVRYQSGLTRRLDTAMRQNVLDGARALFQHMTNEAGKAFGADGMELSAHMLCAEDHLPYQGRQFTMEEYERLQQTLPRRFGIWNCKHFAYPIVLGLSEPAYTDEELNRYRQNSTEMITIDGKAQSRYKWSQEQRRLETAIRKEKDSAIAAKAAGDDVLRRECQRSINDYRMRYDRVSDLCGLEARTDKMAVSGFRRVKTAAELKKATEYGTVKPYQKLLENRAVLKNSELTNGLPLKGKPSSITDKVDDAGKVLQRRVYGADAKAAVDFDTDDHNRPDIHPTGAHKHLFDYTKKRPRSINLPLTDDDLKQNADIIQRGVNDDDTK